MNNFRKIYGLFTILLGISANFLHADQLSVSACSENASKNFFIGADLLYWTPQVSGLELGFGTGNLSQITDGDNQVIRSREVDLDPNGNWSPGYRITTGYHLTGSPWEVEAVWTDFKGKASRSSQENSSYWNEGKYRVGLKQIDALIAYNAALSPCITLKPFLGIRASRINQSVHATIFTDITMSSSSGLETKTLDDRQTYYGMGPLAGIRADWDIGSGFGLYAGVVAGLIYGKIDVNLNDSSVCTVPSSRDISTETEQHLKSSDYNLDLTLGLSCHSKLCNGIESTFDLSFEHHQYFNQNRMSLSPGDLSFDGLSLGLTLDL